MQRILVLCTLLFCTSLSGCLSTLEQAVDEECSFENKSTNSDTLRILSYDILAFDSEMIEAFEAEFGYEIEFIYENDAGGILNQMMLTKNIPQADLAIGLDNTYIQTAIEFCLLQPHNLVVEEIQSHLSSPYDSYGIPFDYGHVCLNLDTGRLHENESAPTSLSDLTNERWANTIAIPSPLTSSPGRAFFLATLKNFDYDMNKTFDWWTSMKNNGVIVTSGWTEAYETHYSGGYGVWTEGHIGDAAMTVSYCHSPGVEAFFNFNETKSTSILYNETSFKQIEYATIINGAVNSEGAKAFITFLLSHEVNSDMPTSNYMYSVLENTSLPTEHGYAWHSSTPSSNSTFDDSMLTQSTDELLLQWSEIMMS
jgi:thiamine transport system substrate-binding protein